MGLLAPLCLCVGDGNTNPEADERICLHCAQEFVELLLVVASELSSPNGQWLEHVGDAYGRSHLTRRGFLSNSGSGVKEREGH